MALKTRSSSQQMKDHRVYLSTQIPLFHVCYQLRRTETFILQQTNHPGLSEESVNLVNNLRKSEKLFRTRICGTAFKKSGFIVQLSIMSNGQHSGNSMEQNWRLATCPPLAKWRTEINMVSSSWLPETVKLLDHLEVKLRLDGMSASELEP